jgi:putative flippase GtrA
MLRRSDSRLSTELRTAVLYGFLGAVSVMVNLSAQWVSVRLYQGDFSVVLSILVGTAAGLPVKYLLDRRYIFAGRARSSRVGGEFLRYASTGVITTLVFWSIEWLFHLAFGSEFWRLVGGAIGLSVGFYLKYRLDARFVFRRQFDADSVPK